MTRSIGNLLCGLLLLASGSAPADDARIARAPDGFEVTEWSGPDLATNIYAFSFDADGRAWVSGLGYIRVLLDDDHDGRADRAVPFADGPTGGAMGLCRAGEYLFATGSGTLVRYRDADGDLKADVAPEKILQWRGGGEHGFHAVRTGPDGWLYLIVGNDSGLGSQKGWPTNSPIQEPLAGGLVRLSPDLRTVEVLADGFRNAYDFDFDASGEAFTYDSDNERCVLLPWYEPTRFYHVPIGGHHGWRGGSHGETWRMPPYFPDIVPPVVTLGRGSPTGVVCYRGESFPRKYHGGFFALDWTFGRLHFVGLTPAGSTFRGTSEIFLEPARTGLAPTDVDVHPATGDIYFSVGGRGTRGAIYRVRWKGGATEIAKPGDESNESSLSEAARLRRRLNEMWYRPDAGSAEERARAVAEGWASPDRLVRQTAARVASRLATLPQVPMELLPLPHLLASGVPAENVLARLHDLQNEWPKETDEEKQIAFVRTAQMLAGDIGALEHRGDLWFGYTPAGTSQLPRDLTAAILAEFPTGTSNVDREISRLAAITEWNDENFARRLLDMLTKDSHPTDDVHYLTVLARLQIPATAEVATRTADALLGLDEKVERLRLTPDRNWPLRLRELAEELVRRQESFAAALLASPRFGQAGHIYLAHVPGIDRRQVAERFLATMAGADPEEWTAEQVELIGELPGPQTRSVLRSLENVPALAEVSAGALARDPQAEDVRRLARGVTSSNPAIRERCLSALESLPVEKDPELAESAARSAVRLARTEAPERFRERVNQWIDRVHPSPPASSSLDRWVTWIFDHDPAEARRWSNPDGVDVEAWEQRLQSVDWSEGDPTRGEAHFRKSGCTQCHSGQGATGPDLAGVGRRLTRDDLFRAIVQPSRDVPERYRTTRIVTNDGHLLHGTIIYEAVDGAILQTSTLEMIRFLPMDVAERAASPLSLMPAGLLDAATNRDLADLYSYLMSK